MNNTYQDFFKWYTTNSYVKTYYGINFFAQIAEGLYNFMQKEKIISNDKQFKNLNYELTGITNNKEGKTIDIAFNTNLVSKNKLYDDISYVYIISLNQDGETKLKCRENNNYCSHTSEIAMTNQQKALFNYVTHKYISKLTELVSQQINIKTAEMSK